MVLSNIEYCDSDISLKITDILEQRKRVLAMI